MEYKAKNIMSTAAIALLSTLFLSTPADAQMMEKPYSFNPQNRASIAALIRSVEEDGSSSSSAQAVTGSTGTTLVCGGSADSAGATGNSSCIILNNSTGEITTSQLSEGDQSATNETTETVNVAENINEGIAEVFEELLVVE